MAGQEQLSPSTAELLTKAIDARLAELHTGLPAKVVAFDEAKQSCDVQPLLKRIVRDQDDDSKEVEERMPQITNVPIVYPAGGVWSITWPLKAGDIVYLTFAERALDRWLEADPGQEIDPELSRKHDLSDAVCIPGLRPRTSPLGGISKTDFTINRNGVPEMTFKEDGSILIGEGASEFAALGTAMNQFLSDLVTALNSHQHTTPPGIVGGPTTGPILPMPFSPPSGLVSGTVKVKS